MNTVVFQQDKAPPHCSNRTLEFLRLYFPGDRLISRRTDNPWPPYSPDLNPPDYFLWGYLKDRVYENNPQTTEVLKDNIRREIRWIPQEMLSRVVDNFNVRVAAVIQRRGAWIKHIINYQKSVVRHCGFLGGLHQRNSIGFQYLWRKNLEGFLIFAKVIAKEKQGHFCGPQAVFKRRCCLNLTFVLVYYSYVLEDCSENLVKLTEIYP